MSDRQFFQHMNLGHAYNIDEIPSFRDLNDYIHTIEYSAYLELKAECERLQKGLAAFEGMAFSDDERITKLEAENKELREALEKSAVLCLEPISTGDICDARLLMESTLAKYKKDSK